MKETVEELQQAAEQAAREEEEQKKKDDKKDGLAQRLAQAQYYQTLVKSADQKAAAAFGKADLAALAQLLAGHIRDFEPSPEGGFKLTLDEPVEVGGLVFETAIAGHLGARDITQIKGIRAVDGRQIERLRGEDDTVIAETDAEPIRLTPNQDG